MSRRSRANHSVVVANNQLGGAHATKMQRKIICKDFIAWCFTNGYPINALSEATLLMIQAYIKSLKEAGISVATMHNRLASIRRAMRALGEDPDVAGITAKTVGLESRDRSGVKEPIPDTLLEIAIAKALELNEPGFAIALRLQRLLGHRGLESLMSVSELEKYAIEASQLVSANMGITKGTKGGRPRITDVIHARANETLSTIQQALVHMRKHGFLVEGGKSGLKSARSKYHRLSAEVGLVGKYSPHSLRYAFACEKIAELRDLGYNRIEALSLVAKYLGHGASRNRYVSQIYGRSVVHSVPIEKRKSRLERAINKINLLMKKNGEA